jgi:hypothetical protein
MVDGKGDGYGQEFYPPRGQKYGHFFRNIVLYVE